MFNKNLNTPKTGEANGGSGGQLGPWSASWPDWYLLIRGADLQADIKILGQHCSSRRGTCLQRSRTQNTTLNRPVWDFNVLYMALTRSRDASQQGGKVHAQTTGPEVINPHEKQANTSLKGKTQCFRQRLGFNIGFCLLSVSSVTFHLSQSTFLFNTIVLSLETKEGGIPLDWQAGCG